MTPIDDAPHAQPLWRRAALRLSAFAEAMGSSEAELQNRRMSAMEQRLAEVERQIGEDLDQ